MKHRIISALIAASALLGNVCSVGAQSEILYSPRASTGISVYGKSKNGYSYVITDISVTDRPAGG